MDNLRDTPITISSTSTNRKSIKSSNLRVPVSWTTPDKACTRESSCTPTPLQKVNLWINSLNKINKSRRLPSNSKARAEFDAGHGLDQDFLRSPAKEEKTSEDELNHYYSQINEKDKSFSSASVHSDSHSGSRRYKRCKQAHTTDQYSSDSPLSPDSEKKKELCSYLQLMKPTDKKTVMTLQNRRSVRVKNLSMLQEKRELEKRLKEENSGDGNDVSHNSSGEIADDESANFYFPMPKEDLGNVIKDFDDLVREDWFEDVMRHNEFPCSPEIMLDNGDSREDDDTSFVSKGTFVNGVHKNGFKEGSNNNFAPREFAIPKPPSHLALSVSDFSDVIQENRDLLVAESSATFSVPKPSLTLAFDCSDFAEAIVGNQVQLPVDNVANIGSKLSDSVRTGKRKKKKKRRVPLMPKSSFKIRLLPKRRHSGSLGKNRDNRLSSKRTNPWKSVKSKVTRESPESSPAESVAVDVDSARILAVVKYQDDDKSEVINLEAKEKFHSEILNIEKPPGPDVEKPNGAILANDYDCESPRSSSKPSLTPSYSPTEDISKEALTFNKRKPKPLHRCLNYSKSNAEAEQSNNWSTTSALPKQIKDEHSIDLSMEFGAVLKIFYVDYNLVVCQESLISFWNLTALGNVLGTQNMWLSKGSVQRLSMTNKCVFKESLDMVVSSDAYLAYIELWTKEHQSDIREGPVADVFAVVYFWKKGCNGPEKKVLQLENIKGFADDVQYCVFKSFPKIIVSWHFTSNELNSKKTFVHCYQIAPDFQSVCDVSEFECVEHYVSSLHNIEGCDTLIMGCGEHKITLWNIEHGYVAVTVEMLEIRSPLSTLWVKCDRGLLFTLQQCIDKELRLIAIHGLNHAWKKLASYVPPEDYDRLKGVFVENGLVVAFYDQGIMCWDANTGETVLEATPSEAEFISGKYLISVIDGQVSVRHIFTHLLSVEDS